MIDFRYFRDPHGSTASTWTEHPKQCGICGASRPGYEGPFFGAEDVEFVCEECLVDGRLAEKDLTTNEGRVGPPDERRAELEQRTPRLVTWQDFSWPVHCDDFCRFEREVGARELNELAPDGDGVAYVNTRLDESLTDFPLERDDLPDGAPRTRGESADPAIYQFTCIVCGEHVFFWDAS